MAKQQLLLLTVLVVTFVSTFELVHAAPLSLQDQYQAALQQVAVLKGNGTFKDCCDIRVAMKDVFGENQPENGIFNIPDACGEQANTFFRNVPTTQASCDFKNGGGWVVILRRNASLTHENFSRSWDEYEQGFGDLNGEFWYGLRNIHCLTTREDVELQIEVRLSDGSGQQVWTYGQFVVDGPEFNYTLHIGQAVGPSDGHDSMAYHNGMQFSTTDRDNDRSGSNCANSVGKSGWWYKTCYRAHLTGLHSTSRLRWWYRPRPSSTLSRYYPFAEMKVRPKGCKVEDTCN